MNNRFSRKFCLTVLLILILNSAAAAGKEELLQQCIQALDIDPNYIYCQKRQKVNFFVSHNICDQVDLRKRGQNW